MTVFLSSSPYPHKTNDIMTISPFVSGHPECDGTVQPRTEKSGQPGQEL